MAEIIIVDDDAEAQEPLTRFLRKAGHHITVKCNGKEALGAIIEKTPDVVILDLLMPEMDGPSLLEVLRSYLRLQALPVVVLTALEEGPLIDRARHAKVNAILMKSKASLEDIKTAIENACCQMPG